MFGKKTKDPNAPPQSIEEIGNVPGVAYDQARAEWALRNGDTVVASSRWFVAFLVAMGLAIVMGLALRGLTPLKTQVPWIVEVDKQTGVASASRITPEKFEPKDITVKATLSRWVKQTLSLDARRTEGDLREAFLFLRGTSVQEFRDLIREMAPIRRLRDDPNLTRVIEIKTVQFIGERVCQVRVSSLERSQSGEPRPSRYVVTMNYDIVPPANEQEMLTNPAGVYITHFLVSEEN